MPAVASPPDGGKRIGRYQPIRRLAVGGMAEIYLAHVPGVGIEGFEKLVVLKRILPQHALDPELLRMFLDEARLSATLTHPHVTEVYDVGTDGDAPFFAMEYVHGANLREILRAQAKRAGAQPLPLPQAIGIVAAAAAGLNYAHDRLGPGGEPLNIVHRDVSPSNVLVSYDGAVKVSDFGIAKWAYQRTRTQEGTLKGKFAYMSPEQCRGRPVDRRSDVFALGTILYEMTTGTAPFSGPNDLDILNQIATGSAPPPVWPAHMGKYPPALAAIVMRALAPDADQRFASMQALQMSLESFARDAGLAVSTVEIGTFMQALFAPELEAWKAAQREGKSLREHLAARPAASTQLDPEDRTATDGFATTNQRARTRSKWRQRAATAAFVAMSAFAGGMVVKVWRSEVVPPPPLPPTAEPPISVSPAAPATPKEAARAVAKLPAAVPLSEDAHPTAKTKPRGRGRTQTTAPTPAPRPTQEARLGAWDPDSPVPP